MYLLQIWLPLFDEGLEDAICDIYAMRNFVGIANVKHFFTCRVLAKSPYHPHGINFLEEQIMEATTLLKFCHQLEKHSLGGAIFNDIEERVQQVGLMMRGGTHSGCDYYTLRFYQEQRRQA